MATRPADPHPGNNYWVNLLTGSIQRQSNPLVTAGLIAAGYDGPFTWTQAKAYASKGIAGRAKQDLPPNPLGGINAVGDFFHRMTEPQTWVRVGEVAVGGILLFAGIRALAHGSGGVPGRAAAKPVKSVAKTAVKAAVPEARLATRVVAKRAAPKTTARVTAHRAQVRKYGAKQPYRTPEPRITKRVSHIYHHKGVKPKP